MKNIFEYLIDNVNAISGKQFVSTHTIRDIERDFIDSTKHFLVDEKNEKEMAFLLASVKYHLIGNNADEYVKTKTVVG